MEDVFKIDDEYQNFDVNEEHLEIFQKPQLYKKLIESILSRKAFYMYSDAEKIIDQELRSRFENAFINENDRGRILFIHGDYNSGKSYLIRYAAALCYKEYSDFWKETKDGRITHPIIIKNFPHNIRSVEGFYTWLLDCLGNPVDSKQLREWEKTKVKIIRLRNKVIEALNAYETRLILLDESQRLLQAGDNNQIAQIFEALKDLTTKDYWDDLNCNRRANFVLCGTSDCLSLLRVSKFIQGRVHTRSLNAIDEEEYANFLATIYLDYVNIGVSDSWDLFSNNGEGYIINSDIALILFKRTYGKAGLTVEIIRDALISALGDNRDFPSLNDYKEVILPGTKFYITGSETNLDKTEDTDKIVELNDKKSLRVELDFDNLYCAFGGCNRSRMPYKKPYSLINHYKREHPESEIYDKEGNRLDNN